MWTPAQGRRPTAGGQHDRVGLDLATGRDQTGDPAAAILEVEDLGARVQLGPPGGGQAGKLFDRPPWIAMGVLGIQIPPHTPGASPGTAVRTRSASQI